MNLRRPRLHHVLTALLVAWAIGLLVATVRLSTWQREMTQVLNQLRADELLRSSIGQRDQVHPEWYRRRALALLSAVEHLRDGTSWMLVMPGSWWWFDDLQQRATERIGGAFNDIVVETIRRELDHRAARLAGIGQDPGTGELLQGQDCAPPIAPHDRGRVHTAVLEDLPAYPVMLRHLQEARDLDAAAQALLALHDHGSARPEHMRLLVRYSLGAELSGSAARSLSLFQASSSLPQQQAQALVRRLQWALWCSVSKGAAVVHAQWLDRNELLAIEDQLARLPTAALFEPTGRSGLTSSLSRLRNAASLIDRQAQLLARGSHDWMRPAAADLGPPHQALLQRVADIRLLGPQAAAELKAQGDRAHARFKQRLQHHLSRADAGIAWQAASGRLALTPSRAALADGLSRLLEQPFMSELPPTSALHPATFTKSGPVYLQELTALVQQRRRFLRESLPAFPAPLRQQVSRYLEDRIGQRAFEWATRFVESGVAAGSPYLGPVDLARQAIDQVETTILDTGSPALARRTRERLVQEVLAPLAAVHSRPAPFFWPFLPAN